LGALNPFSRFSCWHEAIDHLYDFLRTSAYAYIFGQVHPSDRASCIHQKFGWPRDVAVVLACSRVYDTITPNDLRLGIGEKRIGVALVVAKLPRFRRRIDADRGNGNSTLTKFLQVLLETP